MIASHARAIDFRGAPARLYVVRNDGYCWGRIVTDDGTEYDVDAAQDMYDEPDEDALDAFEGASRYESCVMDAVGWTGGW